MKQFTDLISALRFQTLRRGAETVTATRWVGDVARCLTKSLSVEMTVSSDNDDARFRATWR